MATPLIKRLQIQGGTFYGFSSGANDLSKTINNSHLKLTFSKFALLNLPNITDELTTTEKNIIRFDRIEGARNHIYGGNGSHDKNIQLSESFQNYMLNLESLILSDDTFDYNQKRSVAERIFFKWLIELGAIRFKNAVNEVTEDVSSRKYVETIHDDYSRVVQYIGNIDVSNNVQKAGQSYTEIYINVPTRVGHTPNILFEQISDYNYNAGSQILGDDETINGRNTGFIHPDGLSIAAFYDNDSNNSYELGALDIESLPEYKFKEYSDIDIDEDVIISAGNGYSEIKYRKSLLDGISIDFDRNSYRDIMEDDSIDSIQEYNSSGKSDNFEFNTVLVYYDLYEESNPDIRSTNLFGVLFLDNIKSESNLEYIPRIKKYKPNNVTGLNGNAWSLVLNTKYDTSIDNAAVVTTINEYSSFSMDLFIDASVQLQEAAKTLVDTQHRFLEIVNRVNHLESMVMSRDKSSELSERIDDLQSQLENSNLALSDSDTLLDLISKNNDNIQKLINGEISTELQYNTNVLRNGPGILIDKSTPNKIKIENYTQQYTINTLYEDIEHDVPINIIDLNLAAGVKIYTHIKNFTNMLRIKTEHKALNNIKIYLEDKLIKFKTGQTIRISFDTPVDLNSYSIEFYTDSSDRFGNGKLNKLIASISHSDLGDINSSVKPILELICLDESTYEFALDIIR